MFKLFCVGDFHHVPAEEEDCKLLINYIHDIAKENNVDQILFTGDILHYHNLIRLESLFFWRESFKYLKQFGITCLVGNHDKVENGPPQVHSLLAFSDLIRVIDKPLIEDKVLYMPYRHDKSLFIKESKEAANKSEIIINHQSFTGAKFDNDFYDPQGIDLEFIHQKQIIAGHIHTPQQFEGNNGVQVEYIGAPRWRTISDANIDRNLVLFEINNGKIINKKYFSTGDVCKRIIHHVDSEDSPFNVDLINNKDDFRVDIKGTEAYIEKRKKELSGFPLKFRTIKVNSKELVKIRESDGIKTAFTKYLSNYKPKHGTSLEKLTNLSKERLGI